MKYKMPQYIKDLHLERCFICDTRLRACTVTLEHLVPQWIIRRFGLERHTITVTPQVTVPYMDCVVPCCRECNCQLLAPLEARLWRTFTHDSFRTHDYLLHDLAVWSCKIFSGLRLFDLASYANAARRQNRATNKVAPDEMCQFYLRMLRGTVKISHLMLPFPFSAFVFRTKVPRGPSERFDFQVAKDLSAMYVRLGPYALLSRFDGGYLALYSDAFFKRYSKRVLAPLQMEELAAHFFTMAERQAHPLLYIRRSEDGVDVLEYLPVTVRHPFVEHGTIDDFLYWFSYLTHVSTDSLLMPNGRRTFLEDSRGRFLTIPADRLQCFGGSR